MTETDGRRWARVMVPGSRGGALTKSTTGTLILEGTNTYTGATAVDAGILLVNAANSGATGNVAVDAGATLGGTGTLGGDTTIDGTLSTGLDASVGTIGSLAFNGQDLTFNNGSAWLGLRRERHVFRWRGSFAHDRSSLNRTGSRRSETRCYSQVR